MNSVNPHRIAGQATAAYEIVETLGDAPYVLALPVGNGGNITAYWAGFALVAPVRPRAHAAAHARQPGRRRRSTRPRPPCRTPLKPLPARSALAVPASWQPAVDAVSQSGGEFRAVTDAEILTAAREIAHREGIFCEPSSAAGVSPPSRAEHCRGPHVVRRALRLVSAPATASRVPPKRPSSMSPRPHHPRSPRPPTPWRLRSAGS